MAQWDRVPFPYSLFFAPGTDCIEPVPRSPPPSPVWVFFASKAFDSDRNVEAVRPQKIPRRV